MSQIFFIRPTKDLRANHAQISALSRQNPVAITVNGREDLIIQSHEQYIRQQNDISESEARLAVYTHLSQAMDDIKLGHVQNASEAFADILNNLATISMDV